MLFFIGEGGDTEGEYHKGIPFSSLPVFRFSSTSNKII